MLRPATTTVPLTFEMLMSPKVVHQPFADEPVFIGRWLRAKSVVYELGNIRLYENFFDKDKHEFTVKRFNLTRITLDSCIIDIKGVRRHHRPCLLSYQRGQKTSPTMFIIM